MTTDTIDQANSAPQNGRHAPKTQEHKDKIARAMLGNDNAKRGSAWSRAVKLALFRRDKDGVRNLYKAAAALVERAKEGDPKALKELGDRIEGAVKRQVELGGMAGKPIEIVVGAKDIDVV